MRGWSRTLRVLVASMAVALPSLACIVLYPGIDVGPNFKVQVEDRGRPVEGLAIEIHSDKAEHVVLSDQDGLALFRNLPPGSYELRIGPFRGMEAWIEVDSSRTSEVTVPIRWPEARVFSTRSLRGAFRLFDSIPGQSQSSFEIRLLHGVSGQLLGTTNTDEDGAFEFAGITSGLYFVSMSPPGGGGNIAVEVAPSAEASYMEFDVQRWACGFSYLDRTTCPQNELHVAQLEGVVVDETDGAIGGAGVLLLDAAGKSILQTLSDVRGTFSSPDLAEGTYQLVVIANGFTTMRSSMTIDSEGERSRFIVDLGLAGSCSTVRIE